jgi:hypothetical protein
MARLLAGHTTCAFICTRSSLECALASRLRRLRLLCCWWVGGCALTLVLARRIHSRVGLGCGESIAQVIVVVVEVHWGLGGGFHLGPHPCLGDGRGSRVWVGNGGGNRINTPCKLEYGESLLMAGWQTGLQLWRKRVELLKLCKNAGRKEINQAPLSDSIGGCRSVYQGLVGWKSQGGRSNRRRAGHMSWRWSMQGGRWDGRASRS